MPKLTKLSVLGLRNLDPASIFPSPGFNIVYGPNGSGKTSLLEAIYLLGRARTFRSNAKAPLIQHGKDEAVIYGEVDAGASMGYRCTAKTEHEIKLNGKKCQSRAELAEMLPLQLFNADAFKILEGSPSARRSFLDWGVFHVEHAFIGSWRQAQKALASRNSLLKSRNLQTTELEPWTHEFGRHAEQIHIFRQRYIEQFEEYLQQVLSRLMPIEGFSLSYEKGWDASLSLEESLKSLQERDIRLGHTSAGPHRAELKITIGGNPAVEILSRGQQKLLVISMKLAQAMLLKELSQQSCIFLLDDLPAELDRENRARILELLAQQDEQVFVTGIEQEHLLESARGQKEMQLFHVKHGKINVIER